MPLAFALVAAAFLTEMIVSQVMASAIDEAAARITTDYSPSVVELAIGALRAPPHPGPAQ